MNKDFLKSLLSDRLEDKKFFSEIRKARLKEDETNRLNYKWTGRISPSSLYFTMCPKKLVEEDIHKRESNGLAGIHRMNIGTALHRLYQEEAMKITGLLWKKPNIPKEWEERNSRIGSELYYRNGIFSGQIDLLLNISNKLVIADLKFPQREEKSWESYIKTLPEVKHITQVCCYIDDLRALGLFDPSPEDGAILYFNPLIPAHKNGADFEYYFKYKDYEQSTIDLKEKIRYHVNCWNNNEKVDCSYSVCELHQEEKAKEFLSELKERYR